jgi:hypothetical protein
MAKENELIQVIQENKLEEATSKSLQDHFLPFFDQAKEWKERAEGLIVTDVNQTREMKMAREARLALREIRVNANKTRKALKEDSLRYGRAVQGVYNVIEYLIKPIEQHLYDQEKFAEIKEAERKAELKVFREDELSAFSEFVPFGVNLSEMPEDDYNKLLNGARLQFQQKIEAEKKAEAERIAKEKAEAEERERIRKENERLRKEAEQREKELAEERAKAEAERKAAEEKAKKEREAQEAILAEERAAKARLEAEIKAKKEAEEKAKQEAERARIEAEQKAAAASDNEKIETLADAVLSLQVPDLNNEKTKEKIEEQLAVLYKFLISQVK